MLLQQTREAWGQDDQSWLGSAHATDNARSITLDTSAFDAETHYPDGYFLSGIAVAPIGASDLWGPAGPAATEFGFIFCAVKAPTDGLTDVPCAMLDHGRILVDRLPIPVTGAALDNPHFLFVVTA